MDNFLSNIGDADTLRARVTDALDNNRLLTLILDDEKVRKVRIISATPAVEELTVLCSDTTGGSTIVLHLPYSFGSAAQADLISYSEGA